MKIGDLDIYLVPDGLGWVDAGGALGLVPRSSYSRYIVPDENNLVPSAFYSLLIKEHDSIILVDTGLGNKLSPKEEQYWGIDRSAGGLVENLEMVGVAPEDVDIVINTHLHSDHCGGNTITENGRIVPTFPNAQYIFQRIEWADASHTNVRTKSTYFQDNFTPLVTEGRVRLLHGDEEITPHVRCVVTPGHTRGHQSVIVHSDDWIGLFLGDLAARSFQVVRTSWVAAYDIDPLETIRTKEVWQAWAVSSGAWLFFMHDHTMATARLRQDDGRYALDTIEGAGELIVISPTAKRHPG
jgi:glyoxylase-like metal-dependent hydrolase (beta-lactamase superfamily II)